MTLVIVEHFLNEAGRQYFPEWLKTVEKVLGNFEGFQSLQQIQMVDAPTRSHLILTFTNLELLREWARSPEHDQLLATLQPYMLQKQQSSIFLQE